MKLEVITGTKEEFEAAAPCPEGEATMVAYKTYVKELLANAETERTDLVCMRSIPMAERVSDNFNRISWIEQAINEFQRDHDKPELVRIVAESDTAAEQYKVVYNMFYATSKATRLNDDKWD